MSERILVLPHIGTALGHFIRTIEYLNANYQFCKDSIFLVLPEKLVNQLDTHIPSWIDRKNIIKRKCQVSINNPEGRLQTEQFQQYFAEDEQIYERIKPTLIISDPGIQGAILHSKFRTPWINITHGVYRPLPLRINDDLMLLAQMVWNYLNKAFDTLIQLGTGKSNEKWEELRNTAFKEEVLQEKMQKCGWQKSVRTFELLITCCSANEVYPTPAFLHKLQQQYSDIAVAGVSLDKIERQGIVPGITYVGNNTRYDSLIDSHTTVITHGGFGTLQLVTHANRIIIVPSDLDQLCNAIIFCSNEHNKAKAELIHGRDWQYSLNHNPFRRFVEWDKVNIT